MTQHVLSISTSLCFLVSCLQPFFFFLWLPRGLHLLRTALTNPPGWCSPYSLLLLLLRAPCHPELKLLTCKSSVRSEVPEGTVGFSSPFLVSLGLTQGSGAWQTLFRLTQLKTTLLFHRPWPEGVVPGFNVKFDIVFRTLGNDVCVPLMPWTSRHPSHVDFHPIL